MSEFSDRLAVLRESAGIGYLVSGRVIVDQVYAHYQHERLDLRHPHGGHARYLAVPLFTRFRKYCKDYADSFSKGAALDSLKRSMEDLSDQVEWHAPLEFGDLSRSGHPMVLLDQVVHYDRPPKQHRLSKSELRIKNRLRRLPPELIGWIWWHVMHHQEPPARLRHRR